MRFEPVVGWGQLPEGWRYVEVAYTSRGQHETPPREIRSFQKFRRIE
jgi:hypothetical protein